MPLLPFSAFGKVFEPFRGHRVGYIRLRGNVGDSLIEAAAFQMLRYFEIDFVVTAPSSSAKVDEWLIAGGGNMGSYYHVCQEERRQVLADGRPVSVLPQSFITPEQFAYKRVFVREKTSLTLRPDALLAPDLALGLQVPWHWKAMLGIDRLRPSKASIAEGLWLRRDREALFSDSRSLGDPAEHCLTAFQYLRLAAQQNHVITDRLHFAVAALLCGRKTTLLPNGYHKNRSMYETWLRELGCEWSDAP
jgi:exopolysaccharide biosynthesis predicted pyruvyltransferase EpsI